MTMARICESCDMPITEQYVDLMVTIKEASQSPEQDGVSSTYGDYCFACVANGKALAHLMKELDR